MADNAADLAVDWVTTQGINLARVEAGSQQKAIKILEELEGEIVGILDKGKASIAKQKKLQEIQKQVSTAIQKHYATVKTNHAQDLKGVAKAQAKGAATMVNKGIGASVMDPVLSDKQIEKLASDTLVFGAKSGAWWDGQSADLREKFARQMRMGYGLGESVEELTRRVRGTKANGFNDGIMATKKREAEALVRSSIQTISNQARIESIEGMQPLVKGLQWVATLDARTTDICKGLDKLQWRLPDMEPVGHGKQFPGPVAHWNCRSTQVPVTRSWEELAGKKIPALDSQTLQGAVEQKLKDQGMDALKIAQVKVRARASMDGQVSRSQDYEGWLGTKSPEFIKKVLGPSRAALWQAGKLQLRDLTDQQNRPLTVAALEQAIDADELPDETEGVEFQTLEELGVTPAANQQIIEQANAAAQQTAQLEIDDIIANPKGRTLKAKALKKLQKNEPNLPPVTMLAKAEGMAAEMQAAASKASKLSTAKKKIKQGKKPSPSEQAVIDSLEGAELENWKSSLVDAKQVASGDALDKLKAKLKPDGSLDPNDPENATLTNLLVPGDQGQLVEAMKAKGVENSAKMKASLKGSFGFYDDETVLKNTGAWKQLTPEDKAEVEADFKLHQADLKAKKAIDDLALTEMGKEAVLEAKNTLGSGATSGEILEEANAVHFQLEEAANKKAFAELEKIQAGEATVQKKLKQKALAKYLKDQGATLDSLSPTDGIDVLKIVETEAAEKQAAASKASKLSTAKKKILAGKLPSPSEQATIDALTPEEEANFNAAVEDAKAAKASDAGTVAEKVAKGQSTGDPFLDTLLKHPGHDPNEALSWTKTKMAELLEEGNQVAFKALEDMGIDPAEMEAGGFDFGSAEVTLDMLQDQFADFGDDAQFQPLLQKAIFEANAFKQQQAADQLKAAQKLQEAASKSAAGPGPVELTVPPVETLKKIKDLPGSTKPFLAEDPVTGKRYVVKSTAKGLTQAHLASEATADGLYRAAGLNVPASTMADKKTKVAEFLEGGQTLAEWKQGKSQKDINAMHRKLRKGMVADMLFANHDVAGLSNDNILIVDGQPVRIDNGGALAFRAQGAKKSGWDDPTGKIAELESMRDASVNANTAAIYKGITKKEIDEQVGSLLARKDKILETAKSLPAKDQKALARRFDWLAEQFPHVSAAPDSEATLGALQNFTSITPATPAAAKEAKMNGLSIDLGTRDVEDTQALVWQESDLSGNPVTVVQLKVTDHGAQAIRDAQAEQFAQAKSVGPQTTPSGQHPKDTFSQPLISAAKTLAHHADDKQFNQSTLTNLADQGGKLAQLANSKDPAEKALAAHYQKLWDKLMDVDKTASAADIKKAVPMVEAFHYDPKAYEKDKPKRKPKTDRTVEKISQFQARKNNFKDGEGKNTPGAAMTFNLQTGGYRIRTNDGVVVEYADRAGSFSERSGLALEGTTVVRIPGEITPARLERALQELSDLGIDIEPPSDDYKEYLAIRRTAALTKKTKLAGWKTIDGIKDEAERARKARAWAEKTYSVKLPKRGTAEYDRMLNGEANHDGTGWRTYERLDMGPDPGSHFKDLVLTHNTGADLATAVEGMLESGGEATSTMGRVQKGVPVTAGMSSQADVTTGGASYFFTRIRKKGNTSTGMQFKGEVLKRPDAISYTSDKYGRISAINTRKHTLQDYLGMSGSDETIFKNSLDMVRDIERINTSNKQQRDRIIAAYKKFLGGDTFPDGRKITDVVK